MVSLHANSARRLQLMTACVQGVPTRGPIIIGIDVSLCFLATVSVLLRLYSRVRIVKFFGADDYWLVAAWVRSVADAPGCNID